MYNILIFCGGTGSIALQNGIANVCGHDRVKVDIVINAYDNGKSTGECRKLFDYSILGPSDLRKNQLTQFAIIYAEELKDEDSFRSKMLKLYELRMTRADYKEYYRDAKECLSASDWLDSDKKDYLTGLLDYFFFTDMQKGIWRENIDKVNFSDFAISNIFYASCAVMNRCSLAHAGSKMAELLDIPDNIHLISHTPLLLNAYTESGRMIDDEGDIVSWNNKNDKISSVVLRDNCGNEVMPKVDEDIPQGYKKVSELVNEADILIFSSGTQWSSLIPTYMHDGFRNMIKSSGAVKYLVMNNSEDADMKGVSSADMCKIISKYLDLDDVKIIVNNDAPFTMQKEYKNLHYIHASLGIGGKHDSEKLVDTIFGDFFGENNLSADTVMFDLDGTLWNDKSTGNELEAGKENLELYRGIIVSGNNYEYVKNVLLKYRDGLPGKTQVFCDYGNTYFSLDAPDEVSSLSEEFTIDEGLVEAVKTVPMYKGRIHMRGNAVLTIKPLENREEELERIRQLIKKWDGEYQACIAGRTSVDITRADYNKANMILLIADALNLNVEDCIFVGNELNGGSEEKIPGLGMGTINVRDVFECNVFLKSWNKRHRMEINVNERQCFAG